MLLIGKGSLSCLIYLGVFLGSETCGTGWAFWSCGRRARRLAIGLMVVVALAIGLAFSFFVAVGVLD